MEIGIKFCGGCNPRYDRGELARLILKENNRDKVEYVRLGKEYDVVIILQGCHVGCANLQGIKSKKIYRIYSLEEYKNLDFILKMK